MSERTERKLAMAVRMGIFSLIWVTVFGWWGNSGAMFVAFSWAAFWGWLRWNHLRFPNETYR